MTIDRFNELYAQKRCMYPLCRRSITRRAKKHFYGVRGYCSRSCAAKDMGLRLEAMSALRRVTGELHGR